MSNLFIKLLPSEGEIKEGDTLYHAGMKGSIFKATDENKGIWKESMKTVPHLYSREHVLDSQPTDLGKISPDAVWVKDGMEIDPEDILACEVVRLNDIGWVTRPFNDMPKTYQKDEESYILIKLRCPVCKTFH